MRIHHGGFLKPSVILTAVLAVFLVGLTRQEATAEAVNPEASSSLARGQAIFADTCSQCHSARPRPFKTAPEAVPERLHDPRILPHQFRLSNQQLKDLVTYLNEVVKPG